MNENIKTEGQLLNDSLSFKTPNCWENADDVMIQAAFNYSRGYMDFIDSAKTEREFIKKAIRFAEENGFISLKKIIDTGKKLMPGDKIYSTGKGKAMVLAVIGEEPADDGLYLIGAHVDASRLDLKQSPIYEESGLAMLKTHYYGGIKKYQWLTIPLALHGTAIRKDGVHVDICIGEDADDPVFTITDLLPHLAVEQMQKKASEFVPGESLNILVGSIPFIDDKVKDKVRLTILNILNKNFGLVEEDLLCAEFEAVPAGKSRDVGLDRGMVGAYAQDDRVCAYAALRAMMDMGRPQKTCLCVLSDKEEIGSEGNTSIQSGFFTSFIMSMMELTGKFSMIDYNRCLSNSKMLSADVTSAVDPNFKDVQDRQNAAFAGRGVVLSKYSGSRGKSGASDANAEFVHMVRQMLNKNEIPWQAAEMGRVDLGGSGTIALYLAKLDIEVLDLGVPVLSMHSPFELTSKMDIYLLYKTLKAFWMQGAGVNDEEI